MVQEAVMGEAAAREEEVETEEVVEMADRVHRVEEVGTGEEDLSVRNDTQMEPVHNPVEPSNPRGNS